VRPLSTINTPTINHPRLQPCPSLPALLPSWPPYDSAAVPLASSLLCCSPPSLTPLRSRPRIPTMKQPYSRSGKCGNMVWQRNRYGQICYPAFIPANPRTPAQQAIRGIFGAVSQRWRTLTEAQRLAWIAAAARPIRPAYWLPTLCEGQRVPGPSRPGPGGPAAAGLPLPPTRRPQPLRRQQFPPTAHRLHDLPPSQPAPGRLDPPPPQTPRSPPRPRLTGPALPERGHSCPPCPTIPGAPRLSNRVASTTSVSPRLSHGWHRLHRFNPLSVKSVSSVANA
jgi:hypothetical protein